MDLILDELRKNDVDIDMRTLSHHINYLLREHEAMYNGMVVRINPDELSNVFVEMNVNNFGRAMAYLTLVYMMKDSEDRTRRAVRLVVAPLRSIDFSKFKIEESFFRRMVKRIFTL